MRLFVLCFLFLLATGCATQRSAPRENLDEYRPVHVVLKKHEGPIASTIDSSAAQVAGLYQFGFIGGFVGGMVQGSIDSQRKETAEAQIQPLRKTVSEDLVDLVILEAFRSALEYRDEILRFDSVTSETMMQSSDTLHLASDGLTLIIKPTIEMSPSLDVARVSMLATAYRSESEKRVYRSTLECHVGISNALAPGKNALIWTNGSPSLLETELDRCARTSARFIAADMFKQEQFFDLIPIKDRGISRDRSADVMIGSFDGYKILEKRNVGHLLVREIDGQLPFDTNPVYGKAIKLDEEGIIQRINSEDPLEYRAAARVIVSQSMFSESILDAVAARILLNIGTTDAAAVDATAWLCKVLGFSGKVRYRDVLDEVSTAAAHSKLKKYALWSAQQLPQGEADQFRM